MMKAKYGERQNWRCLLRDNPIGLALLGPCYGPVNGHELKKASAWRAGRLDPDNVVLLCNGHNGAVENHPIEATKLGLVIR
jgi:hypothetical protein